MNQSKKCYKEQHPLDYRKQKVEQFSKRYPDMTPIIVEKHKKCKLPDLQRTQYLVNQTVSFAEFRNQIKNKLVLLPTQSLFVYCGNNMIGEDQKLSDLYNQFKDKQDGFLYLQYSESEVFGQ